ncbi:MAG: hypothetical protein VKQ33_04680 [Candidatus Sericytochromatia bacterium]|nr:hypothetical protein [Candidatus Sericytochromatia bacterium]
MAALLAPVSRGGEVPAVATQGSVEVGTALALDTSVQALLSDAELLVGNGLVGLDGGLLLSDGGARLVSDGGLRYVVLGADDEPAAEEAVRVAREGWRGLSEADREARKALHRQREERVLELAREGLQRRRGAFRQVGAAAEAAASDGGKVAFVTLAAPGGEVVVTREVDAGGTPVRVAQRFVGQLEGVAVEATRSRTFRPDGSVQVEASTLLGVGAEARTLSWRKTVSAEGEVTGAGSVRGTDGQAIALAVSGAVTGDERVEADVEGIEVAVVRGAGRDEAEVRVRGRDGKEQRGKFRATLDDRDDDAEEEVAGKERAGSEDGAGAEPGDGSDAGAGDDDKDGADDDDGADDQAGRDAQAADDDVADADRGDGDSRDGGWSGATKPRPDESPAGQPSPSSAPDGRDDDDDDGKGSRWTGDATATPSPSPAPRTWSGGDKDD